LLSQHEVFASSNHVYAGRSGRGSQVIASL
jgi:hypothetical protein